MVCLGNICRSPLAHGILEHLAREKGLDWEVDSAGTGDWHIGHAPDDRSVAVANKYGIDISGQRARQITSDCLADFDHVLVMDQQNYLDVLKLAQNEEQKSKVTLFLPNNGAVPDPYLDSDMFEPVYEMVAKRCEQLIEEWSS